MTLSDRRLALLLTQFALAILLINELVQILSSNSRLSAVLDHQAASSDTVKHVDTQLDALARGTQRLAQGGDADAQKIVDTLAQSGVHINTPTSPH